MAGDHGDAIDEIAAIEYIKDGPPCSARRFAIIVGASHLRGLCCRAEYERGAVVAGIPVGLAREFNYVAGILLARDSHHGAEKAGAFYFEFSFGGGAWASAKRVFEHPPIVAYGESV